MRPVAAAVTLSLTLGIGGAGCATGDSSSGQAAWSPEPIPEAPPSLVEVLPVRDAPVLGVQVEPGRLLVMAPSSWEGRALVRCVRTGVTGEVVGVADWWSAMRIEWALLDVRWHGEAPAVAQLSGRRPAVGAPLRIVSVRNRDLTPVETTIADAACEHCWLHSTSVPFVGMLRPGAPVFDDEGRIVALYGSFGVGPLRPDGVQANIVNLISAVQWKEVAPRGETGEEAFREALLAELTVAKTIAAASQAHDHGDFASAIEQCAPVVEADPDNGWAWQIIGMSHFQLKQYAEAADALRAALRRTDTPFIAKAYLAACALDMGDKEEAAALAMDVAGYDDANATSLRWAAYALGKTGHNEEAANLARRALELEPDDEWAQRMLRAAEEALNPSFGQIQLQRGS